LQISSRNLQSHANRNTQINVTSICNLNGAFCQILNLKRIVCIVFLLRDSNLISISLKHWTVKDWKSETVSNLNPWKTGKALPVMWMPPNKWLRVGNQSIQKSFTGGKETFWGLRGAVAPSRPPLVISEVYQKKKKKWSDFYYHHIILVIWKNKFL